MRIDDRVEIIAPPGVTVQITVNVRLRYRGRLMLRAALLCGRLAGWFAKRATASVRYDAPHQHLIDAGKEPAIWTDPRWLRRASPLDEADQGPRG